MRRGMGALWSLRLLLQLAVALVLIGAQFVGRSLADSDASGLSLGLQATPQPTVPSQGPFVVVIVVDAARYDQFDPRVMPHLAALQARGTAYSRTFVGQLPSVTEAAHATLGTGLLPKHHLIMGDTWRVPGTNQMSPNLLDGALVHSGYIAKLLRQRKVTGLTAAVHTRYPGSVVVSLSGHKAYAADAMGGGNADFVAYGALDTRGHFVPGATPGHAPAPSVFQSSALDLPAYPRAPGLEDGWTTTLALRFLTKYHPRVLMVNLPEVDVAGHAAGVKVSVMQPLMKTVDTDIGRFVNAYKRAGLFDKTYFIVTSDHGMVPAVRTVQDQTIQDLVRKAGGDPLYVGHGDYCSIWLKNPEAAPAVAGALSNANLRNVAAVYVRKPKGTYELVSSPSRLAEPAVHDAFGDLLSTFDSEESPDVVVLYDENTMTMKPFYVSIGRHGDHGGATWGSQHIGLVMVGPGVKSGFVSQYPARLVDVVPTLETMLGITPQGLDGVPLADALLHPPEWAVTQQKGVEPALTHDVESMVREATLRPNTR